MMIFIGWQSSNADITNTSDISPRFLNRSWVTTLEGRASFLGHSLPCVLCDDAGPSLPGPEGSEPSGT